MMTNPPDLTNLPVAILGAGPVGLAAAAELILREIPFVVLEAGDAVGAHVSAWGHVRMFSPWRFNVSRAQRQLLEPSGWHAPNPDEVPTGSNIVTNLLAPFAALPSLRNHIQLSTRVVAVTRAGLDKVRTARRDASAFMVRTVHAGLEMDLLARAVIDCTGTFSEPNPAGTHGIPAPGERGNVQRIAYGMPDVAGHSKARYAGRRVAVLGSGHSAIGVLLDLLELKTEDANTRILWLSRRTDLAIAFGGEAKDALPARGALGSRLHAAVDDGRIEAIHPFALHAIEAQSDGRLRLDGAQGVAGMTSVIADELVVAAGFRPQLDFLREIRLDLDPALECPRALAPMIDPNVHSCGTVRPHGARELAQPEPGFYLAGMKSYGRAPTFLLATGYEQVRSIVAEIAGDHEAAARVELELPETGVCSTDIAPAATTAASGCCGGPPVANAAACCVKDEVAKAAGEAGCGCGKAPAPEIVAPRQPAACCG